MVGSGGLFFIYLHFDLSGQVCSSEVVVETGAHTSLALTGATDTRVTLATPHCCSPVHSQSPSSFTYNLLKKYFHLDCTDKHLFIKLEGRMKLEK